MSYANDKPFISTRQETMIGLFLVLLIACALFFFLIRDSATVQRSDSINFHTTLSTSHGITTGASVRMKGLVIGEVTNVSFDQNTNILVNFSLNSEYRQFYTEGSFVKPDDSLGIDQVLSGVGLVFHSAGPTAKLMREDSNIISKETKSINDSIAAVDIDKTIVKVEKIINNLSVITGAIAANETNIEIILNNTAELSNAIVNTNNNVNDLIADLDKLSTIGEQFITQTNKNVNQNLVTVNLTLTEFQKLAKDIKEISENIKPVAASTPELADQIELLVFRSNILMMKLNNHWLIDSDETANNQKPFRIPRSSNKPD